MTTQIMATKSQKNLYVECGDLKDKYQHQPERIKSHCKAIAQYSRTTIESQVYPNGTASFELIGPKGGVTRALQYIIGDFCVGKSHKKYTAPEQSTRQPVGIHSSSQEAMQLISTEHQKKLIKEGNTILLTEAALRKFDLRTGACELRQFGCRDCDNVWWKIVDKTKPVSRCKSCSDKYDALPREKEFGIGRCVCPECGLSFFKRCTASDVYPCRNCNAAVKNPYIHPKFAKQSKQLRRPPPQATQEYPSPVPSICYPSQEAVVSYDPPTSQRKPLFQPRRVVNASTRHVSTGSTLSSFLTEPDHTVEVYDEEESFFLTVGGVAPEESLFDPSTEYSSDVQSTSEISESEYTSDTESMEGMPGSEYSSDDEDDSTRLRKHTTCSDAESDSDDDAQLSTPDSSTEKLCPDHPESDSGIGTASAVGTDSVKSPPTVALSDSPSAIHVQGHPIDSPLKTAEFKHEFPGVVFSKNSATKIVNREGAIVQGEGIELYVPENAVPSTDEVEITLQGCLGGPFVLPKGYVLASPVFLISPPFAFHQEVILTFEHFAYLESDDDCRDMIFVSCPTKPKYESEKAMWYLHSYGEPEFQPRSQRGRIKVKHFCFGALARFRRKRQKDWYLVSLYSPAKFVMPCHAVFCVTLYHTLFIEHLQRYIEKRFKKEEFHPTSELVRISEEVIELVIPVDNAAEQGYDIFPDREPCKITKESVDFAREFKPKFAVAGIAAYPPRIVLEISTKNRDSEPSSLRCTLKVTGINCSNFTLSVNPFIQTQNSGEQENESEENPLTFNMKTLTILRQKGSDCEIRVIETIQDRWKRIGRLLRIVPAELDSIAMKYREDSEECCCVVLRYWLENGSNDYPTTWSGLVKLLQDIKFKELAKTVKSVCK